MIKALTLFVLLATGTFISAQTPQWNWAKGIGSNGQDYVDAGLHLDSAGNVYELISISGNSITLAGHTFTNPDPQRSGGGGGAVPIFVKYNSQGQVVWANQHFPVSNGLPYAGGMMYTDRQGYTYMLYAGFRDSLTIQGLTLKDTSITNSRICLAKYDPDGNIVWIRATRSNGYTYIMAMKPWDDGHFLLLGQVNNGAISPSLTDTINGIPLLQGSFLAVMDTSGKFERVKYLGSDTITFPVLGGGTALFHEPITSLYTNGTYIYTNAKKSIYLALSPETRTVWDTSIHITDALSSLGNAHTLILKFDSALSLSWSLGGNAGVSGPFATDINDNLYVGATGNTQIGDTIQIGNIVQTFPVNIISPSSYFGIIKIDSRGNTLWIDTFFNIAGSNGNIQALFTDLPGNIYMGGRYDNYLNAAPYTLPDPNNLFVIKMDGSGNVKWMQGTHNAGGRMGTQCNFGVDEKGNVYTNGIYFYTGQPGFGIGDPIFGHDSLIGIKPINGFPVAPDIFTARLGNCDPAIPALTAASSLHWCGTDSVQLTSTSANTYLWNTADTAQTITIRQSGVYAVYAIDTLGCYAQSKPDTIKTYPQPVLQLSTLQNGGTEIAIATTTSGTPGYNYLWNDSIVGDTITNVHTGWYYAMVTDTNGCTASDSVFVPLITSAKSLSGENTISIYPNPTTNSFYIETPVDGELKIYNAVGELAQQQIISSGKNKIATTALAKGIYLIEVISSSSKYNSKLIIQ